RLPPAALAHARRLLRLLRPFSRSLRLPAPPPPGRARPARAALDAPSYGRRDRGRPSSGVMSPEPENGLNFRYRRAGTGGRALRRYERRAESYDAIGANTRFEFPICPIAELDLPHPTYCRPRRVTPTVRAWFGGGAHLS